MRERIRITKIADSKTGQLLSETTESFYANDWYIPGRGYKLYGRSRTKLGMGNIADIPLGDRGTVLTLLYQADKHNRLPTAERLGLLIGKSTRTAYRIYRRLQSVSIVKREAGDWFLSPAYAFGGVYLSPALYSLFKKELEGIVPAWARKTYETTQDRHT